MNNTVNTLNIQTLHAELLKTQEGARVLTDRVAKLEGNLALALAELSNTKQLMAHIMGRGMGATAG